MKLNPTIGGAIAGAVAALAFAAPAFADIHIIAEECAGCDNVHLVPDANTSDFLTYGTTQGGAVDVIFTGLEPIETGTGNGLPWVHAEDGTLTYLDTAIQGGYTFTDLGFNLNEQNLPKNPDWFISITGYDLSGSFSQSFTLNHNTAFHVYTTNGQVMTHVTIQQLSAIGGGPLPLNDASALDGVGQIKIGGVAAVVPEPASWALMIVGFGGVGAILRRRHRMVWA